MITTKHNLRRAALAVLCIAALAAGLVTLERPARSIPNMAGKIAYAKAINGQQDIYVMGPDGYNPVNVSQDSGGNDYTPALSPTGSKIAFTSDRDGNLEVYSMSTSGSIQANLTNNDAADEFAPAWSPRGTRLAYVSDQNGNGSNDKHEIFVMSAGGSNKMRLTDNDAYDGAPVFSPDGKKIAFTSDRKDGNRDIYVMDAEDENGDGNGDNVVRLTADAAIDTTPAWSPDGSRIAFMSTRPGVPKIYAMKADGANQVKLSINAGIDDNPAWSPDGSKIAFTRAQGGQGYDVFKMDASGGNEVDLTGTGDGHDPDWGFRPCTKVGTNGDDLLYGTSGNDVICGLQGDDEIRSAQGDDTIFGDGGKDTLEGGPGRDAHLGGAGGDTLDGQDGAIYDTINGQGGIDACFKDQGEPSSNCP